MSNLQPRTFNPWCVAIGACFDDEHWPECPSTSSLLLYSLRNAGVWVWPSARNIAAWEAT